MNCAQPGCAGLILDGFCDQCGMAPAEAAPAAMAAVPGAVAAASAAPAALAATPSTNGGAVSTGASTATSASPSSGRAGSSTRTQTGRGRLGAGLVEIPPVSDRDPADAVMANPSVQENRRFCSRCEEPVGRGRDGLPGRPSGFCRKCGTPFSFDPKLHAGDLVAGQYEVVGCLAHGGMGWIYLARDRNVSDRWVVLKGILNAGDPDATAAALAERRFLAQVEHPNIVKIFNFVEHEGAGYIVMEYVGGQSLKQLLAVRREAGGGQTGSLPATQAIAYTVEILPALGHLHDLGLLFCDFKLDNVIQTQHSLKLIDLGAIYRLDEPNSAVFGTVGYQAPEIASLGPSVASDLFTVARTLAVMCFDFRGYQSTYRYTLPAQDSVELFRRHDSLYRVLERGTAADPRDRFADAEEMADQLLGVLRETVAEEQGRPVPGPSRLFTVPLRAELDRADWRTLPRPQADPEDPSAGYLAALTTSEPAQMIAQLRQAPSRTREVDLRLVAAMIEAGEIDEADELLAAVQAADPREWRTRWYQGLAELARGNSALARERFTAAYASTPGELAPKLALGLACETAGATAEAVRWYEIVARTDASITSAAFGLARCRLELGDRRGAVAAYDGVPDSSSGYLDAQTARIRSLIHRDGAGSPTSADLIIAGSSLHALPLSAGVRDQLTAEVLREGLALVLDGSAGDDGQSSLLGHRLTERDLRFGLESSYRALARHARTRGEAIRLVDQANRFRPRTWT